MRIKVREWIKRYGPAEVCGLIGALIGGGVSHWYFQNNVLSALGGTWGENIGYYATIISRDLQHHKKLRGMLDIASILKIIRNLAIEFGPAEYLDSFLVRPFMMYIFPKVTNNLMFGLILGKFAADAIFYIPTIISYELKKKVIK